MIVVMESGATQAHVDHVIQLITDMGLKTHPIIGTDRTVIAAIGDKRNVDKSALENAAGVESIVAILAPYKRASREVRAEPSTVPVGPSGYAFGSTRIGVIAGPCSVEDRAQLLDVAHRVKEAGAIGLRGGAFKPRTDPYSFRGHGERALEMLAAAREATGLAVVTEVMSLPQVELVAKYADVLQVGARNMHNFDLLVAVAHAGKPILLKRGWSATFDEFLLAAEYIMNEGNDQVILCERGIRTHETYVRNTLPLGIIPAVKRRSHLPIVIDPSHGTGHAYMVPAMCRAAVAAGADGLIVEVHPDPEHALTDGAQSINHHAFAALMNQLARIAQAIDQQL
ncbi:MAG: 3-deoxy-7-phosphoheptulonate synthase [Phycisphaerae bacterium]